MISTHVTTSGGLISAAFIENIRELGTRQRGAKPESFALRVTTGSPRSEAEQKRSAPRNSAALEETIAAAWELLLERWDAVRADLPLMDVSQVRARWLLPLFQLLDFDPLYLRGDTILDEAGKLRYPLSHRGWQGEDAPVLHTVVPSQDLDTRMMAGRGPLTSSARGPLTSSARGASTNSARGASTSSARGPSTSSARSVKAKSPHDMLQAFLNASPADRWAVLSNGVVLRLLRDYHHTFTKGYVQFDLESIFETRNYGDFRALYRMGHASRFLPQGEGEDAMLPLERFYKDSLATGIKVGEDLRGQVRQAIETLGNGFLNGESMRQLQADADLCRRYYGEILRVIYRVLFLLFAEQRGMLPQVGAPLEDLYREQYSITALRARAEGDIPRADHFGDLWQGLCVTFRMIRQGAPELGVFGYNGMLFEDSSSISISPLHLLCSNSDLLRAVRALTLVEREGVLQRISYADLGVEELGAIYESLLDYTPRVTAAPESVENREIPAHTFFLDPRGAERKTTGSYYTHPSLVNELIKSALLPVARERLAQAGLPVVDEDAIGEATAGLLSDYAGLSDEQRAAGEAALLDLKVCDPAAGSGHFLVKADNTLGAELARVRTGDEYPPEDAVQAAKRDVLARCMYAVDLNPMAVELCKVSLWINASVRDAPLNFLDHHIKCGNSLIGATPELMADGIPTDAFKAVTGDHKPSVNATRKRNRSERAQEEKGGAIQASLWQVTLIETQEDLEQWRRLSVLADKQPKQAREAYGQYTADPDYLRKKLEADFWTAAFFWPLTEKDTAGWTPTHGAFRRLQDEGPNTLPLEIRDRITALVDHHCFFHWHLEFPDVFDGGPLSPVAQSGPSSSPGFDVILGNPPWERIKLQEKEFFAARNAAIASARTAAARRKLIQQLPQADPALAAEYAAALRHSEGQSKYLRNSGRYPLTGVGDVNTYQVFAGLARQLVAPTGRGGVVLPIGIATDYYNRNFFTELVNTQRLQELIGFENEAFIFSDVHHAFKFCALTIGGEAIVCEEPDYIFFCRYFSDLENPQRHFTLTREDIACINPNTGTVPIFRTKHDAKLTSKLYRAAPVLINKATEENPWGVRFATMFHMASDSGVFRTRDDLETEGAVLEGNRFVHSDEVYLPLYEAKMVGQFDNRFGTYADRTERGFTNLDSASSEQHLDPRWVPAPFYWVESTRLADRLPEHLSSEWLLGFRDITNSTNERTSIFCFLPRTGIGHTLPLVFLANPTAIRFCMLIANFNALTLDFIVRQKMGGMHLTYFILRQLPVLPPDHYTPTHLDYIVPRVVELTYTAWDLQAFAQDILAEVGAETWARWFEGTPVHASSPPGEQSATPAPFVWDEERRAHLRAELDALYAHLYGLTRDELAYILDTFPIVRRKDEEKHGEYRTKRLVLEAYEWLKSLKQ